MTAPTVAVAASPGSASVASTIAWSAARRLRAFGKVECVADEVEGLSPPACHVHDRSGRRSRVSAARMRSPSRVSAVGTTAKRGFVVGSAFERASERGVRLVLLAETDQYLADADVRERAIRCDASSLAICHERLVETAALRGDVSAPERVLVSLVEGCRLGHAAAPMSSTSSAFWT